LSYCIVLLLLRLASNSTSCRAFQSRIGVWEIFRRAIKACHCCGGQGFLFKLYSEITYQGRSRSSKWKALNQLRTSLYREHLHYCPVVISFLIIWYDIGIVAVDFRAFHVYFCQPSGQEADGSSVPYTCSPVETPRNPFKPPIGLPEQIRSHISCAILLRPGDISESRLAQLVASEFC